MMLYDYLIVGSGLYGAVFAHEALRRGKRVLVVEKRGQAGGNIACAEREGIPVHLYGAHIFHTSDPMVWAFVNRFVSFNSYINSPIANFHGELYNLPFNMNTFYQMWGVKTPSEAKAKIEEQKADAVAKMKSSKDKSSLLTNVEKNRSEKTLKRMAIPLKDLSMITSSEPVFIINNDKIKDSLGTIPVIKSWELKEFENPSELLKIIRERKDNL